MSLNYEYLFSQIDKAKKKKPKHYVPWNSPESKKLQAAAEAEKKEKEEEIESTGGRVSQRMYKRPKDRKPGEKPGTYREGYNTPFKDEAPQSNPRGNDLQAAHSSLNNLTEEERAKRRKEAEEDSKRNKKLSPKEREAKRRRGKIQISDLKEGESHGDPDDHGKIDATYKKIQETKRISAEHRKREKEEKEKKPPNWASGIRDIQSESENPAPGKQRSGGGGLGPSPHLDKKPKEVKVTEGVRGLSRPTVRDAEEAQAKELDRKRDEKLERLREAAGRKTGIRGEPLAPGWWKEKKPEEKKTPKKTTRHSGPRDAGGKEYDESSGDVQPESDPEAEAEAQYQQDEKSKSLWKSWLKNKVSMSRMQPPKNTKQDKKRKEQQEKMERKRKLVGTLKKPVKWNVESPEEEESWEHFKERQDASDKRVLDPPPKEEPVKERMGTFVLPTHVSDELARRKVERKHHRTRAQHQAKINAETKKRKERESKLPEDKKEPAIKPKEPFADVEREARDKPKKKEQEMLPKGWYKEHADFIPEEEKHTVTFADAEKSLWKAWLKEKAEEGIGGMNMGAQRGLGHEAGYKQDPGQTAQITEVKDEKEKSAYENHEQDEGAEVEPNKQQIPPSKPGMDTFKSLYKKALIAKYNNIYKPANI